MQLARVIGNATSTVKHRSMQGWKLLIIQPLGPDGRPLRAPTAGPMLVATGAFLLAFGVLVGVAWLALGACVTASGLVWLLVELRRGAGPRATARRGRLTPTRLIVTCVGAVAIAVLAATSRVVPETPSGGSAATPPATSPAPGASLADGASQPPAASQPSGDLTLDAENLKFLQTALWAPAGQPFSVAFDNRDNVPHNLEIREAAGSVLFMGDIVTGPTIVVYDVAALPAGVYPFVCTVHPSMTGTLTVK